MAWLVERAPAGEVFAFERHLYPRPAISSLACTAFGVQAHGVCAGFDLVAGDVIDAAYFVRVAPLAWTAYAHSVGRHLPAFFAAELDADGFGSHTALRYVFVSLPLTAWPR